LSGCSDQTGARKYAAQEIANLAVSALDRQRDVDERCLQRRIFGRVEAGQPQRVLKVSEAPIARQVGAEMAFQRVGLLCWSASAQPLRGHASGVDWSQSFNHCSK
jgi:hypothetical protein